MDDVEYKLVPGAPCYRVGSDGSVWTRKNARWGMNREWRPLKASPDHEGYCRVTLMIRGRRRMYRVNVLVCELFIGKRPAGHDSCHRNGMKTDNRLANLRWGSRSSNMLDAFRHGTLCRGGRHHAAKLTDAQMDEIRASTAPGVELAGRYRVSQATISRVRHTVPRGAIA